MLEQREAGRQFDAALRPRATAKVPDFPIADSGKSEKSNNRDPQYSRYETSLICELAKLHAQSMCLIRQQIGILARNSR